MVLAQLDGMQERFYSISSQIALERQDYYLQLEKQQRGSPDITGWLSWFLDCLVRSIERAETVLGKVKFKAALWSKVQAYSLNERQRLILNRMLEDGFEGFMHTSKYAKLAKCSNDTALRDIQELKEKGILTANAGGGRSTSYRIIEP